MRVIFRDNEYYVGRSDYTWYTFTRRVPQDAPGSLLDVDGRDVLSQEVCYPAGVNDVAFMGLYHEGEEEPVYLLEFVPQRWFHDYAVRSDPAGNIYFIVSEKELEELFDVTDRERVEEILAGEKTNDLYLRDSARLASSALQWMKDWDGPFEIAPVRIIE